MSLEAKKVKRAPKGSSASEREASPSVSKSHTISEARSEESASPMEEEVFQPQSLMRTVEEVDVAPEATPSINPTKSPTHEEPLDEEIHIDPIPTHIFDPTSPLIQVTENPPFTPSPSPPHTTGACEASCGLSSVRRLSRLIILQGLSIIKALGEESFAIDEGKQLEFAGVTGFRKTLNKGKCYDVLDERVKRDHPEFIPPERKLSDVEEAAERDV